MKTEQEEEGMVEARPWGKQVAGRQRNQSELPWNERIHVIDQWTASDCAPPMQIVSDALRYFGLHFSEPIPITELAGRLGISEACLIVSFDRIRGMTPAQALQEHRLNRLFAALSDQPRQGLSLAIRSCGLAQTTDVVSLFEQTFGIDMSLFLLTCRRAADDRQFRRQHPEPAALVLPT